MPGAAERSSGDGSDGRDRLLEVVLGAVLAVAVALPFLPALRNGFFWDDRWYVVEFEQLRTAKGLWQIWFDLGTTLQYYPMVWSTFWLEYRLFGLDPLGYHATNLVLQAVAAVLCWRVLRHLEVPGAFFAALLFGLHPIQVESVAWISERKNVLSGAFYFAAALAWLHAEGLAAASPKRDRRPALGLLALLLFVLALLSKTTTCTLPAVFVLVLWWKQPRLDSGALRRTLPYFALGVVLAAVAVGMEKSFVGAVGREWVLTPLEQLLLAGRILVFYAGKVFWPHPLAFFYDRWAVDARSLAQYLYPLLAVGALALAWRARHRFGRGPVVALLFFAGTLTPALGLFNVYPMRYSWVADHFQYLASLGVISLACAAAATALERRRALGVAVGLALAAGLSLLTARHAAVFKDDESVWRDTIAKTSTAWVAHNNLGNILRGRRELEAALAQYQAALAVKPDYADALNNIATVHGLRGDYQGAGVFLEKALAIDPAHANARKNLALLQRRLALGAASPDAGAP